ncbi:hypothetical protein [Thermodesulfovibrio yellowstonii]|uniref:Uncharacterized protein n=1 Tax=Thermodesulfovibrio yellowstonii TaxID=28262 RepID=A0A9W6GIF4_9BACT|nr:hypothetical protein [Thermodesulfovibrio islandicus]GLI54479.1 hypothetical protein TISLANDTSLP1_21720 [Thermodesulfovibrio islandicus]
MKPFILLLTLIFMLCSYEYAEASNTLLTPELKREITEKMEKLKNIEKPGLRSPEELAQELFFHLVINSTLITICEPIIKESDKQKRKEKIDFAEMTIVDILKNPDLQKVPAYEKSLAYLMLINLANLKNDRKKANEYNKLAFENIQRGLSYYSRINESPVAKFNILLFKASMRDFFNLKVDTSPDEELEMANITQKYPLLKERLQSIAVNFSILNSLYNLKTKNK